MACAAGTPAAAAVGKEERVCSVAAAVGCWAGNCPGSLACAGLAAAAAVGTVHWGWHRPQVVAAASCCASAQREVGDWCRCAAAVAAACLGRLDCTVGCSSRVPGAMAVQMAAAPDAAVHASLAPAAERWGSAVPAAAAGPAQGHKVVASLGRLSPEEQWDKVLQELAPSFHCCMVACKADTWYYCL